MSDRRFDDGVDDPDRDADELGDLLEPLPPLGSLDQDEELGVPGGDPAAVPSIAEGPENVGLDDEAAGGDAFAVEDMFDPDELVAEQSWTQGSEASGDDAGSIELPETAGSEYGWTADTEAAEGPLADLAEDLDLGDDERVVGRDAGEVGLDEDVAAQLAFGQGEDDIVGLRPLVEGEEELADDLDIAGDALIDAEGLSFDEEAELSAEHGVPPALEPAPRVTWLGPAEDAIVDLVRVEGATYAVGTGLYWLSSESLALVSRLKGHRPASVTHDGTRLWVTTEQGALMSGPDFESFTVPVPAGVACSVAAEERSGAGPRLWLHTTQGQLFRSEDAGATWAAPALAGDVAAFAVDRERRAVAVLLVDRGYGTVALSSDGGRTWDAQDAPDPGHDRTRPARTFLAVSGSLIALGHEGDHGQTFVSDDGGKSFEALPELRGIAPLAAASSDAGPVVFGGRFSAGSDRGVVLRRDAAGELRTVLDVAEERSRRRIPPRRDPDGDNRVLALALAPDRGAWCLLVATGAGVFQLDFDTPESS